MKTGINVVSFFDGMACGFVALKRDGIKVNKYYAFEIDKYTIKIAQKNHPEIIELGDVNNWKNFQDIETPDLIIAGSPCQGFSVAGKGLNFEDPRSKLFFVFVDALNFWKEKNPSIKFLLENVKMKKEWVEVINQYTGVEPVEINSALVSAQNRKRLYWTNIEGVTQPEDRGLVLRDILEGGEVDRLKSYCVDANYFKGENEKSYFGKGRRQLVFNSIKRIGTASDINGHDILKRIYSPEGKSPTLDTQTGGNRQPKVPVQFYLSEDQLEKIKHQKGAKSIKRKVGSFEYTYKEGAIKFPNPLESKSQTLVAAGQSTSRSTTIIKDEYHYRKLTPLECERLQTLDDNYTSGVSNTQRYKMVGNGWTVEVIRHIFSFLPEEFYTG